MTTLAQFLVFRKRDATLHRADGRRRGALGFIAAAWRALWGSIVATAVVAAVRTPGPMLRYIRGAALSVIGIWLVVAAYMMLAKPSYTSRWTLILPTSASSVSMQVESIGHAQSTPSSPFGSSSLSPKVIYKEIIGSELVRLAAAKSLGMTLPQFGAPRVKLIDETAIMQFEIAGPTAALAQRKAEVLIEALHAQLDVLRRDEIQRRADVVQQSLTFYQTNLQSARSRILEQQQQTGVLSLNQYNESATGLELQRRRLGDVRADLGRLATEQKLLAAQLGMDAKIAASLLRLSADPAFNKAANEYADSSSLHQTEAGRLGSANPLLALSRKRAEAAEEQLRLLGVSAGLPVDFDLRQAVLVANGTHRSDMLKGLVASEAAIAGKREELATLEAEFQRHTEALTRMSTAAARLEDLRKDHLVAEAVFTSALARLDTNKVDIYGSYPMVQTLAAPDLPERKSSPNLLLALIGGFGASLLAIGGWTMAWLRHMFVRRR